MSECNHAVSVTSLVGPFSGAVLAAPRASACSSSISRRRLSKSFLARSRHLSSFRRRRRLFHMTRRLSVATRFWMVPQNWWRYSGFMYLSVRQSYDAYDASRPGVVHPLSRERAAAAASARSAARRRLRLLPSPALAAGNRPSRCNVRSSRTRSRFGVDRTQSAKSHGAQPGRSISRSDNAKPPNKHEACMR